MVQNEKMAGLGQMVAGVAHEINNPLAFVTNNVAVLQRDFAGLPDPRALRGGRPVLARETPELAGRSASLRDASRPYMLASLPDLLARTARA